MYGEDAAKAAILYILLDWRYLFLENELPKDKEEVEKLRDRACEIWKSKMNKLYDKIEEKSG
jgi:hypothetical protein